MQDRFCQYKVSVCNLTVSYPSYCQQQGALTREGETIHHKVDNLCTGRLALEQPAKVIVLKPGPRTWDLNSASTL